MKSIFSPGQCFFVYPQKKTPIFVSVIMVATKKKQTHMVYSSGFSEQPVVLCFFFFFAVGNGITGFCSVDMIQSCTKTAGDSPTPPTPPPTAENKPGPVLR